MNQIIAQVCQRRCVDPAKLFGPAKATPIVEARREVVSRLKQTGLGPQQIANATGLHVQTVYYWLSPRRRETVRRQSKETYRLQMARLKAVGGRRQTKQQREEILAAYLEDPAMGTALACSRGLSPLYAYKLANALGLIPRRGA